MSPGHLLWILFGPGTWGSGGNMVAWVLCGIITFTGSYFLRNVIGKKLAGWWHRHHGPLAVEQHLEALRKHEESKKHG